jgi:cobaltochelatase CobS
MDLIGRDTMTKVDNPDGSVSSVSVFVDGMLPRAMSSPYILMLDEIDFVRPDVAYVMQAATEGNGLRITEDGDRFVKPHENFRMFASANTVGQGDEYGLYQGARPQSQALLDRFTVWTHVEYLDPKKRDELVKAKVPGIKTKDAKTLSRYADEHQAAFVESTILQPLSPRGLMAIAQATVVFGDIRRALATCVLNKANKEDRSTLRGIIDRVCK